MLSELKELFTLEGIDLTAFPLTLDSWFASQDLREKLFSLGFENLLIAGKSSYVFTIQGQKHPAKDWKGKLNLQEPQWGVDVPHFRAKAQSPHLQEGGVVLFGPKYHPCVLPDGLEPQTRPECRDMEDMAGASSD